MVVEGTNDVEFLRRISRVVHEDDSTLPDLAQMEDDGRLIFLPIGGSKHRIWSHRRLGAGLLTSPQVPTARSPNTAIALVTRRPSVGKMCGVGDPRTAVGLGWGRVSCMTCIFGDRNQWAALRRLAPRRFQRISAYERQFGKTIHRSQSVVQQADHGQSFVDDAPDELKRLALGRTYAVSDFFLPPGRLWLHPPGAFKRCGGPS